MTLTETEIEVTIFIFPERESGSGTGIELEKKGKIKILLIFNSGFIVFEDFAASEIAQPKATCNLFFSHDLLFC